MNVEGFGEGKEKKKKKKNSNMRKVSDTLCPFFHNLIFVLFFGSRAAQKPGFPAQRPTRSLCRGKVKGDAEGTAVFQKKS